MAPSVNQVLAQMQRWTAVPAADLADAVLLERYVRQDDQAAFAALVARYGPLVLRVCQRFFGTQPDVDDAFQATFLVLARKAASLRQPNALPGWLHAVARRVALKALHSNRRPTSSAIPDCLPDPHPDPLTQLTARELLDVVEEEVQRLPLVQRSAVLLCCLEGHSREEAARRLGWTHGAVKNHLQRGRQRLHARLQRRGIALPAVLAVVAVSRGQGASPLLLRSTVTAVQNGCLGSAASALAHGVLKTMFLTKLAGVMALVLTVALAASASLALVYRNPAAEPSTDEERGQPAVQVSGRDARAAASRTDALGDPLPAGAIARLGTVRFRHGGRLDSLVFTEGDKQLIGKSGDEVRIWDVATGKELRQLIPPGLNWSGMGGLSADGERLVVVHRPDSTVDLWDVRRGKKLDSFGKGDYAKACISPDHKLIAVSDNEANLDLWDVARHEKLRSWKAQKWQIESFQFTADSRRLLTCGTERNVRIWDTATGRKLLEVDMPNYSIQSMTSLPLSPDGKLFAFIEADTSPQGDGTYRPRTRIGVWDATTGKRIQQLTNDSAKNDLQGMLALTFTADSKRLLTSGPGHFLRIWDPLTGKELRSIPLDPRGGNVLALSKDGKTLAAGSGLSIHLLDLPSGKAHEPPEGRAIASAHSYLSLLAPDGRTAITSSWDNAPLIWDVATGRVQRRLEKHDAFLLSLQISPDGKTLYSRAGRELWLWDLPSGKVRCRVPLNFKYGQPKYPLLSPDNRSLFMFEFEGIIHCLDAETGKERYHFQGPKYLWGIACTPDSQSLVGWSGDYQVRIWDAANGRLQKEYTVPKTIKGKYVSPAPNVALQSIAYSAALSSDGRLLAMASTLESDDPKQKGQYPLLFKDMNAGRDLPPCEPLPYDPELMVFSPDGRMLAWGGSGEDPAVHLLEVASGRERRRFVGHRGHLDTLQFSASGDRLLSGSIDTTALVWDLSVDRTRNSATDAELEAWWADLGSEDAARAYRAIHRFAAASNATVAFLGKYLHPVPAVDEKRLAILLADLGSDDFAARQKASEELMTLGEKAIAAYRKTLDSKPSLEARRRVEDLLEKAERIWWDASGERLRRLRAIEALELARTPEARRLLASLAAGAAGARQTQEARSALQRLVDRTPY